MAVDTLAVPALCDLVVATLPPHTQVALTRPVQAAHNNKRLRRMVVWMDGVELVSRRVPPGGEDLVNVVKHYSSEIARAIPLVLSAALWLHSV